MSALLVAVNLVGADLDKEALGSKLADGFQENNDAIYVASREGGDTPVRVIDVRLGSEVDHYMRMKFSYNMGDVFDNSYISVYEAVRRGGKVPVPGVGQQVVAPNFV